MGGESHQEDTLRAVRRRRGATENSAMEKINSAAPQKAPFNSELDNVFHPEQAFEHPQHVAEAPDLTLNEKCAILASWAGRALARNGSLPPSRTKR
jgi:hypothetical protein